MNVSGMENVCSVAKHIKLTKLTKKMTCQASDGGNIEKQSVPSIDFILIIGQGFHSHQR